MGVYAIAHLIRRLGDEGFTRPRALEREEVAFMLSVTHKCADAAVVDFEESLDFGVGQDVRQLAHVDGLALLAADDVCAHGDGLYSWILVRGLALRLHGMHGTGGAPVLPPGPRTSWAWGGVSPELRRTPSPAR